MNNLVLHIHPPLVPGKTLDLTRTWGLGGMSVVLVMLLALTGILLMLVYEPFPGRAYDSIVTLQEDILFGSFVRNIHHWSGNLLVIVAFLHLLRVFFTGAFQGRRRLNWLIGLGLFLLIVVANFTGYLLPWDQLAYWAVTICVGMLEYLPGLGDWLQKLILDGEEVGPATLSVFFTIHVVIVPIGLFLFMPYHFWLVRKAGGVVSPRSSKGDSEGDRFQVPTVPNLVVRELVAGLVLIACVLVYALIFDAPLDIKANPGLSPNPTKAPWYFAGIQEMLMHFHPLFAVWVIPGLLLCSLVALPYLRYDADSSGLWFHSPKGRRMGVVAALTALLIIPPTVFGSSLFMDLTARLPMIPPVIRSGLIPLAGIVAVIALFYVAIRKGYAASKSESVQAVFILLLVTFMILSIICCWFRGPGMALVWPFFKNP